MAETKTAERIISGTGVLRMPPTETAARYYSVLVDVLRLPLDIDRSFKFDPFRQRFATVTLLRDKYVLEERYVNYTNCRWDFPVNEPGQILIAFKCAHKQLLQVLAGSGTPATSVIEEFANLELMWTEMRFCCHSNTLLKVTLYEDVYDECGDDYREKSPPPPPPPPPPTPLPVPVVDVSPPYEDDDDVTNKFPDDDYESPPVPEFPQGIRCNVYAVSAQALISNGTPISSSIVVFGEVEFVGISPSNPNLVIIICHGDALAPGASCKPNPVTFTLFSSSIGFQAQTLTYTIS